MHESNEPKPAPPPGEADTPQEARDETAPEIRRLRHGDGVPQSGD